MLDSAKVGTFSSSDNIQITGDGQIDNIQTNGAVVTINGPINLNGKIEFKNDEGLVIAKKEPSNKYAKLNSSIVKNGKVNVNLDKIYVNIDGQSRTLEDISKNIDKIGHAQEKFSEQLYIIAERLASINQNTLSIKANTRAFLMNAMQNTRDNELRKIIIGLIPEVEQKPLTEFLKLVDKKSKEAENKERWKKLRAATLKTIIGAGVMAGGVAIVAPVGGIATTAVSKIAGSALKSEIKSESFTNLESVEKLTLLLE